MIAFACAFALAVSAAASNEPAPIVAVSGNGGLTAGINADGVLAVLRWPNPGGPDQLATPVRGTPTGGGRWGIRLGENTLWVGDTNARVTTIPPSIDSGAVEATIDWPGTGVRANLRYHIAPGAATLLCSISVSGAPGEPETLWRADWAPRTKLVPELPYADGALDAVNGFAAFIDAPNRRVWHLRPDQPGREDARRARALGESRATLESWVDAFPDGLWIGVGLGDEFRIDGGEAYAVRPGSIASIVVPPVVSRDGEFRATIAIAIGPSFEDAATLLGSAPTEDSFESEPRVRDQSARLVSLLHTLTDPATGRIVRGVSAKPPLARDWPRYGAWAALALGGEVGARILDQYLTAIRRVDAPGEPYGSLPESFYTNGEIASPRFIVDDRGPARTLFAARRVSSAMPPEERAKWIGRHADSVRAAAEFLTAWADPRRGAPLWSSDPVGLTGADTHTRVFDQLAGVVAAIELLNEIREPVPDSWNQRAETLCDLTAWIVTTRSAGWSPVESIVTELSGLEPAALEAIARATRSGLEDVESLTPDQSAHLAAQATLLNEKTATIPPDLVTAAAGRMSISGAETDSYRAALGLYTLKTLARP